jgi:hypothetical protein
MNFTTFRAPLNAPTSKRPLVSRRGVPCRNRTRRDGRPFESLNKGQRSRFGGGCCALDSHWRARRHGQGVATARAMKFMAREEHWRGVHPIEGTVTAPFFALTALSVRARVITARRVCARFAVRFRCWRHDANARNKKRPGASFLKPFWGSFFRG